MWCTRVKGSGVSIEKDNHFGMIPISKGWTRQRNPPFALIVSHIFILNDTTLLILASNNSKLDSLWTLKYGADLLISYSMIVELEGLKCNYFTASLDNSKQLLYLFGNNGRITKINLKTKKYEISKQNYHNGAGSRSLFINKQFHIFGGLHNNHKSHFIWNESKQMLSEIYKFEQIKDQLTYHSIQYLKSRNCVLIIPNESQQIYLYSLSTNKLNKLSVNMPKIIKYPETVLSRNEQYVIIFQCYKNDIFILDLTTEIVRTSHIDINHVSNEFIMTSNSKLETLLCFGYIRECWNLSEFSQVTLLPYYLIKLIDSFFAVEIIHTMNSKEYLTVNIDDVLVN